MFAEQRFLENALRQSGTLHERSDVCLVVRRPAEPHKLGWCPDHGLHPARIPAFGRGPARSGLGPVGQVVAQSREREEMPTHVLLLLENVDLGVVEARVFPRVVRHLEVIRWEEVGEVEHSMLLVPVAGRFPMHQVDPSELFRKEKTTRHTFERVVPRVR